MYSNALYFKPFHRQTFKVSISCVRYTSVKDQLIDKIFPYLVDGEDVEVRSVCVCVFQSRLQRSRWWSGQGK